MPNTLFGYEKKRSLNKFFKYLFSFGRKIHNDFKCLFIYVFFIHLTSTLLHINSLVEADQQGLTHIGSAKSEGSLETCRKPRMSATNGKRELLSARIYYYFIHFRFFHTSVS